MSRFFFQTFILILLSLFPAAVGAATHETQSFSSYVVWEGFSVMNADTKTADFGKLEGDIRITYGDIYGGNSLLGLAPNNSGYVKGTVRTPEVGANGSLVIKETTKASWPWEEDSVHYRPATEVEKDSFFVPLSGGGYRVAVGNEPLVRLREPGGELLKVRVNESFNNDMERAFLINQIIQTGGGK